MNKGQSLFEVVVALAISALIITTLVSLVSNSIQNANFSKNKTLAANYSQEAIEWVRGQRDLNTTAFITKIQTPKWCLQTLSWSNPGVCTENLQISNTPFTREVSFSVDSSSGKNIIETNVSISWTDTQGSHVVKNSTEFADWRER
jgi:type II secretory pathway pseudopilin PulG